MRFAGRIGAVVGVATLVALPWAMHGAITTGRAGTGLAVIACAQVAMMTFVVCAGLSNGPRLALAAGLAGLAGLARSAVGSVVAAAAIDHALIYGALIVAFARSLRPGRVDVATAVATRIRGPLAPAVSRYTRRVTRAWCLFFAADLAASLVLWVAAPRAYWSLFVNVLDLPLVATMFVAEYAVRRLVLPGETHVPIGRAVRAFAGRRAAETGGAI